MKPYIKPMTRMAQTCTGEEIEVKVTDKKSNYYQEVLQEPLWITEHNRQDDRGF